MRSLFKIFCLGLFASLGIAAGAAVFSCIMVVEVKGTAMLPELEPGDRVVVLRSIPVYEDRKLVLKEPDLRTGDLVLYEAPYYTADGEGLERIRRITGSRGSWIRLKSDMETVSEEEILAERDTILGKVIFNLSRRDAVT